MPGSAFRLEALPVGAGDCPRRCHLAWALGRKLKHTHTHTHTERERERERETHTHHLGEEGGERGAERERERERERLGLPGGLAVISASKLFMAPGDSGL